MNQQVHQIQKRNLRRMRWRVLPTCFIRVVEPIIETGLRAFNPFATQRFRAFYLCKVCNKKLKLRTSVWPHMETKQHEKNMIMERLAK